MFNEFGIFRHDTLSVLESLSIRDWSAHMNDVNTFESFFVRREDLWFRHQYDTWVCIDININSDEKNIMQQTRFIDFDILIRVF